ncbi:RhuM family protein, partial [Xanthomonas graminis]
MSQDIMPADGEPVIFREIRASEAWVDHCIREIFAIAVDYRKGEHATQRVFAIMRINMHYAAICLDTAKNSLDAREIENFNCITVIFFEQAEFRAMRRQGIRLSWEGSLDKLLGDAGLLLLDNAGGVSSGDATGWAEFQYFRDQR